MKNFTRREFIGTGAAVAGAAATGGLAPLAMAQTPSLSYTPEPGAKLRVLRWNSRTPRSLSSRATFLPTAAELMPSRRAASEKLPASALRTKLSNPIMVSIAGF